MSNDEIEKNKPIKKINKHPRLKDEIRKNKSRKQIKEGGYMALDDPMHLAQLGCLKNTKHVWTLLLLLLLLPQK
jgi:hypothetical protein